MIKLGIGSVGALILLLTISLVSCKSETIESDSEASRAIPGTETTYTDPFAYCKAVGTIDEPDLRYVGTKLPEAIALGLRKAFGAPSDAPLDVFERGTYWRCMDGKVYACNVGANLPCQEKADSSRQPNEGMKEWCESSPDSEFIPAYASGRATIFGWRCNGTEPKVVKEITKPDAAGYISNIWYEIKPK
jgi:hypothetical protein